VKEKLLAGVVAAVIWVVIFTWNVGWFFTKTGLQIAWWFTTQWFNIDNKKNDFIPWWDKEVDTTRRG